MKEGDNSWMFSMTTNPVGSLCFSSTPSTLRALISSSLESPRWTSLTTFPCVLEYNSFPCFLAWFSTYRQKRRMFRSAVYYVLSVLVVF